VRERTTTELIAIFSRVFDSIRIARSSLFPMSVVSLSLKEKVEQGKGTADHLMPLGYLFEFLFEFLSRINVSGLK